MALGLLLQVSCICFSLFHVGVALPAPRGYGYPSLPDYRNMGDVDDDAFTSELFDDDTNAKPPAAHQPVLVSSQPSAPSPPAVATPGHGRLSNWVQATPHKPIFLPFPNHPREPEKPQQPSSSATSTDAAPGPAHQAPAPKPPTLLLPIKPLLNRQPGFVNPGSAVVNPSTPGRLPHLVFEDIFRYPSENTRPQSSPGGNNEATSSSQAESTNEAAQPVFPAMFGGLSSTSSRGGRLNFVSPYKPHDGKISWHLQKPAAVPQRVSDPLPLPRYIYKSRSRYNQGRKYVYQSRYIPGVPVEGVNDVKGPAAPKGSSGN